VALEADAARVAPRHGLLAKLIERGRLLEETAAHSLPLIRPLARPVLRHRVLVAAPEGAHTHAAFVRTAIFWKLLINKKRNGSFCTQVSSVPL
jgi:hypothetical protein